MHENTNEIDLREFGRRLLKRVWLIVLCAALVGAGTFIYTKAAVKPMYEASISVYVNNNSQKDSQVVSSSDLAVAIRLAETYVNIIRSDRVLEKVIAQTGLSVTPAQLRTLISAEPVEDSEMFNVTVTTANPQVCADVANVIAEIAPAEIADIIEGSSAKIIDYAKVPTVPVSPNVMTNTAVGIMVGLLLAVAFVFAEMMLDSCVRSEEDLMRISQLPVLGRIPDMLGDAQKSGKQIRR